MRLSDRSSHLIALKQVSTHGGGAILAPLVAPPSWRLTASYRGSAGIRPAVAARGGFVPGGNAAAGLDGTAEARQSRFARSKAVVATIAAPPAPSPEIFRAQHQSVRVILRRHGAALSLDSKLSVHPRITSIWLGGQKTRRTMVVLNANGTRGGDAFDSGICPLPQPARRRVAASCRLRCPLLLASASLTQCSATLLAAGIGPLTPHVHWGGVRVPPEMEDGSFWPDSLFGRPWAEKQQAVGRFAPDP